MKHSCKRYLWSVIAALLLSAVALGTLCQPVLAASSNPNDYGVVGSGTNTTWKADELFVQLFGESPTPNEADYLNNFSGISFTYNSSIPTDTVSTFYDGGEGTLTVSVLPFTYTASNQAKVSWIPERITVDGTVYSLTRQGDAYVAVLADLFYSEDFDMTVDFSWTVEISSQTADALLTSPYSAAEENLALLIQYEAALEMYEKALLDHEAYLSALEEYEAASDAFDAYEKAKKDYDLQKAAYETYKKEKAAYDIRYNAFLAYQAALRAYEEEMAAYIEYDNFVKNNQDKYFAYLEYLDQMEAVYKRLNILETLFVKDSRGWEFYASFIGGAVSFVLDNQDLLISGGCDAEDVRNAGDSTERLISLMKKYQSLRSAKYTSQHQKDAALFDFYVKNYDALASDFQLLYSSLYGLYQNPAVAKVADSQGKLVRFREFIAQLYITASCLNDSITQSSSWGLIVDWRNNKMMYLGEIVEPAHRVSDPIVASPAGITLPAEVAPVEKVDPVEWPGDPPAYVEDPRADEPAYVEDPGDPPTEVQAPGDAPDEIPHPGDAPAAPTMAEAVRRIAEDLRNGQLPRREPQQKSHTLTFAKSVVVPVSIRNQFTVVFYDMDGVTVLDRQVLDYGSEIIYRGPSTEKPTTPEFSYLFNGWYTFDGNVADLSIVRSNLSLVASYKVTRQNYAVMWMVDGVLHEVSGHYYGEMPVCKRVPQKASDRAYDYVFSGWEPELLPVTGEMTYNGHFDPVLRSYNVTWQVGENTYTDRFLYGSYPEFTGDTSLPSDDYAYSFVGWKTVSGQNHVSAVYGDVTYIAQYSKLPLGVSKDGTPVSVTHTETQIRLDLTDSAADISNAIHQAIASDRNLQLCYSDYEITLSPEALLTLNQHFVSTVQFRVSEENVGKRLDLVFSNRGWQPIALDVPLTVSIRFTPQASMLACCYLLDANGSWIEQEISRTGGKAVLSMNAAAPLLFREEYFIRVESAPNCDLFSIPTRAVAGERIDLSKTTCFYGYEILGAVVTLADGTEISTDSLCFVMPSTTASIRLTVQRIVYHVQFIINGEVVDSYDRYLGELIAFPDDPTLPPEGDWIYTFTGWSNNLKAAYGENRNLVYEAMFAKTNPSADNQHSEKNNNKLLTVILPIFLGSAAVIAVSIFLLTRFKHQVARFFRWIGRGIAGCLGNGVRGVREEIRIEQKKHRSTASSKQSVDHREDPDQSNKE